MSQAILVIPTARGASNRMETQGSSIAVAGPRAQLLTMCSVFTYAKMAEPTPSKAISAHFYHIHFTGSHSQSYF